MQMLKSLKAILRRKPRTIAAHKAPSSLPEPGRSAASTAREPRTPISIEQLETIALSSVRLAAMGPRLATLAGKMEQQVDEQARHMAQIALGTKQLAETLNNIVGQLQDASTKVHLTVGDIARIAKQTRILSINASIEASRAGEQGRAFNVVAQEVQQLADQTHNSTSTIEERVQLIQGNVRDLAASVIDQTKGRSSGITVQAVNSEVQAMAATSGSQREDARSLHGLSAQTNSLTEELLLAVGGFRLAVHRQAAQDVGELLTLLVKNFSNRRLLEDELLAWLKDHPGFELIYVTNNDGRQTIDNIGWKSGKTVADASGYNRDWRDRPWYRSARNRSGITISDIYRSAATGDFCFTVSSVVSDAAEKSLGVLGADVNFQRLISGDLRR